MRRAMRAEALKLCTLPGIWLAGLLALAVPMLLAWLASSQTMRAVETGQLGALYDTSTTDSGFTALTVAQVGFVVLGVLSVSSEYVRNAQAVGRGRQLTTSMVATPGGARRMVAKLTVLLGFAVVLAVAATAGTLAVARWALGGVEATWGNPWPRAAGAVFFLVTMTVIAAALAELVRGGTLPLTLLVINSSAVSFSFLLSKVTPLARYAPDLALAHTFLTDTAIQDPLSPGVGMLVGAAWGVAAIILAVLLHARREA